MHLTRYTNLNSGESSRKLANCSSNQQSVSVNMRVGFTLHMCGDKSACKVGEVGASSQEKKKRGTLLPKTKAMNGFWEWPSSLPGEIKRSR
jgi:hypothetical protein